MYIHQLWYHTNNLYCFSSKETLLNVSNSNLHQLATWTSQGNGIVIINSDNLFYLPDVSRSNIYYQITNNGGNGVYNGRPDWVYEGI